MNEQFRIFNLLLFKNLIVRARHWIITLLVQILIPVGLFILTEAVRDFNTAPSKIIENDTYYEKYTKDELLDDFNYFTLYYVPNDEYTSQIINYTRNCLQKPIDFQGFNTEEKMMEAYAVKQALDPLATILATIFEHSEGDKNLKYKIRHNKKISDTLFIDKISIYSSIPETEYFLFNPFLQLQMCVDESFLKFLNSTKRYTIPNYDVSIQKMPYPPFVQTNDVAIALRQIISMVAVTTFLIPLCIETNYIAKEKFIGAYALMAMNGVRLYQNLLSWLATGTLLSTLYIVPITILYQFTFSINVDPYLYYSNTFIFWLLLTVHVTHLISFGMHVAAYFSKPRFVIIVLIIVYTASSSLYENMVQEGYVSFVSYLGIFLPNILLSRLFAEMNNSETKLIGIHWSNLFVIDDPLYGIVGTSGFIFIFSIIGTILHFTLAVYVNNLRPGKYGIPQHPLYFLKFIKGNRNKVSLDEEVAEIYYNQSEGEDFEAVPNNVLTPGIQIRDLKKNYNTSCLRKSFVQALRGISVDFYKGQVTALLGHNGAGKTTLMSILTGITDATEGKVFVNGKNVQLDLSAVRNDLGLCPQENLVFPDLNVFEQIEFFGLLKGKNKSLKEIKYDANLLLNKLKLTEKRDCLPDKLSGGQKRRLCLGMALIGNASTLILDEPTSGMDPETRRDTWDIILKLRGEKTILLSTHNMEEADILGDRIAIVHGGKLKSYGTPMFLKKQYGHGCVEVTLSIKSSCNPEIIRSKFDTGTQQITLDNGKLVLSVPYTDNLAESLDNIEREKKILDVTGVSVSLITLEEVFLKIIKKEENDSHLDELFMVPIEKLSGWSLCTQIMLALIYKKLAYARKNICNQLLMVILPILSIILMTLSFDIPNDTTEIVPLNIGIYRYPKVLYSSENDVIATAYNETFDKRYITLERISSETGLTSALLQYAKKNIADYRNHLIISAEFNYTDNATRTLANGFYSSVAVHSIPLTMNHLMNAILRSVTKKDKYSIELSRQQFPDILGSKQVIPEIQAFSRALIISSFLFPTISLFLTHPLEEVTTKVKQLQRMTGVNSVLYWGIIFILDFLNFALSIFIMMLGLYVTDTILDIRLYYAKEILTIMLLLLLMGVSGLLTIYIFTFLNKSRNTIVTVLNVVPIGLVILQFMLQQIFIDHKLLHNLQKIVFRLFPYVSFFHGQISFFTTAVINAKCRKIPISVLSKLICFDPRTCCQVGCNGTCIKSIPYFNNFEEDINLEESVIYLCLIPLIYFCILVILEERLFLKLFSKLTRSKLRNENDDKIDEYVKKEKRAVALEIRKLNMQDNSGNVEQQETNSYNLTDFSRNSRNERKSLFLAYELSKKYGNLMAVKEISFRVNQQECFGLLGVNGAGKSTTFRMLTGEEIPNSGNMYLMQHDINTNRKSYLAEMGYCPQTDALINSLNAFEHLRLFARLRGIPNEKVELEVNKWINRLNLKPCAVHPSHTYSGGNKRRLNIAMALIGNPTLVLLDEPTTGVDPAARRSLWAIVQSCQAAGQAVILTSHSMEECEALCNRLVIMVKGQLVCIGASQELKQRFGAGYDINIKLNPGRSNDDVTNIKNVIESALMCEMTDENMGFIVYHVMSTQTTWKKMYSIMNDLKQKYDCIEDFSVLSATLEQLFIQFARGVEIFKYDNSPKHSTSQVVVE